MDINDLEITDQFVMEAKEHLDTIEDDFLLLERQKENPDRKLVDKVFRAIHSIKGGSGFLGLTNIGKLSHVMETLLSMIRAGEMRTESECIDALLAGTDLLGTMLDDVADSNQVDIDKIYNRLNSMLERKIPPKIRNELNTQVKLSEPDGKGNISFNVNEFTFKNIPSHMSLYVLKYDLTELAGKEGKSPVALIRELLSTGEIIDAKLDISTNDLHAGLPDAPLMYEVLYATILFPDDIQEITGLSEDRIVHVGRDGSMERVSEVREQGAAEVFTAPDLSQEADDDEIPDFSDGISTQDEMAVLEKQRLQNFEALQEITELPTETEASFYIPYSAFSVPEPAYTDDPSVSDQDSENDMEMTDSWTDLNKTVRISVDILDKLMALASELVLVRNQQLLAAEGGGTGFRTLAQRLDLVTTEMQETIMRTRMQPIGRIFRKFPRIVRELGRSHGKDIRLTIAGGKVELDKTILESLTDPLTHLIRNCCDHGIEMPEDRIRNGKPEAGHILLNAWHEAGHINIEIRDDGKGIDTELLRRKAVEKGLKALSEVRQMDDREVLNLILLPGFTTTERVSDLSGRGVGMDVVKAGIEKLSGSLEIDSEKGQGTAFRLRLPLTLAIIPCLIVASGPERYAIPQINLVELVCLYDDDVRTKIEYADNQEVFRLRDMLLPMVRLSEVLANPGFGVRGEGFGVRSELRTDGFGGAAPSPLTPDPSPLLFSVLKAGTERFGLIIDRVLGTEEIVVKPMHPCLKSLSIYSGATVMGDGCVSLILDTEGIAAHAGIKFERAMTDLQEAEYKSGDETQTVLLFKYGEKEQFAMALPLIRRIEYVATADIGYVGDREFITVNGISTRILRLDSVLGVSPGMGRDEMFLILPKYIKRPLGLLVSELVDIEETAVELNVESYMADGLLGTSVIAGKMTLFIDIYRLVEKIEPEWFSERRMNSFGTPGPPGNLLKSQKKKVLVVEDISFFRQLIKGYLEADGYNVVTAENGEHALERMAESVFDLIVSDLEMPVMDGWDFVRHVRRDIRQKDTPVIALTALDSEKDREKAGRCGYNRYEVKLDRERFLTSVAEIITGI